MDFYSDVADSYKKALAKTIAELFSIGESFYYVSLTVDEGGATPVFSAWSREAYIDACEKLPADDDPLWIKWSYSDSPYFNYKEENFFSAHAAWESKGSIDEFDAHEWINELNKRLNSLVRSFSALDDEGLFGAGENRNAIVINVEIVPPTHENTIRVKRLNPQSAIKEWLDEASE